VSGSARIAVLLIPGIGTLADLSAAHERTARVARIATHCTEADISEQHFAATKELGMEAVGFLMMSHMLEPERLAEQAALMAGYGADSVYIVDSAGALVPDGVRARVGALREVIGDVGFHAHNNLGLAVGNTVAAIEAGAARVDGRLRGLGAGAGNAATELLAATLDRMRFDSPFDTFALSDAAEHVVLPMMPFQPFPDRESLAIGYAGVYSTFLLHAKRHGERLRIDPRAILVELGARPSPAGRTGSWTSQRTSPAPPPPPTALPFGRTTRSSLPWLVDPAACRSDERVSQRRAKVVVKEIALVLLLAHCPFLV
jgi:4-hydroxy 2-oxovalerate aldolase